MISDMKAEVYLAARAAIVDGSNAFLCTALHRAWQSRTGEAPIDLGGSSELATFMKNTFPEFLNYYDGLCWFSLERHLLFGTLLCGKTRIGEAWWDNEERLPRIMLVDHILRIHHS